MADKKPEPKSEKKPQPKPQAKKSSKIAVVRVRGDIKLSSEMKQTFGLLNLHKKNWCSVFDNTKDILGLVNKLKDYVTWGEINDETHKLLLEKKAEEYKGPEKDKTGKITYTSFKKHGNKNIKKFFRLNPPRSGYGRKGVKVSFTRGGALGYRGEKINDLIQRMI